MCFASLQVFSNNKQSDFRAVRIGRFGGPLETAAERQCIHRTPKKTDPTPPELLAYCSSEVKHLHFFSLRSELAYLPQYLLST